jgi:hypothetical protein
MESQRKPTTLGSSNKVANRVLRLCGYKETSRLSARNTAAWLLHELLPCGPSGCVFLAPSSLPATCTVTQKAVLTMQVVCKELMYPPQRMERQALTHNVHVPRGSSNLDAQNTTSVLGDVSAGDGALIAMGVFSYPPKCLAVVTSLNPVACYIRSR